ncbi:MAG TPA: cobalamin biosynthesis bifunctional protein CbiET, partial [Aldersonia sp.]
MSAPIAVVGIGADGWAGLGEAAKRAITDAEVLMGSARQLGLVPASPATRLLWPAP